ncbi:TonB-dependent receptor [candidate division KSB1 bacterium]|nr:TonB-dependent receptor [candidate division KSB1 bacterium]
MKQIVGILILLIFSSHNIYAQNNISGKIYGTVIDEVTKEPLPGANVLVVGTVYGAASDENGNFLIDNVPAGVYSVRATVIGFTPVIENDVVVSPIKPHKINFVLKETVIEFAELTVKPDYFTEASDKPVSSRTQTNEEIRRLPGGLEDVVRAVSILPGVAQAEPGRNDLIVRGGAPSENLYVVDGIEVPNINHFGTQGAGGGPLSFINLEYVENTTFSTGGFGVRYGDKLSSVLNLRMRNGREDKTGGKGTISATQFGLNLEGPVNSRGSYLFSARRSYLDFIFKAAGFGFVPEYWDFLGKVNYSPSQNNRITVLGIAAIDRVKFFNDTSENRYTNSTILGNSQNQFIGGITWRHIFRGGFSDLTFGQTVVQYNFIQSDTLQRPIFKNNSLEHESVLTKNIVYYPSKKSELTLGLQAKAIRLNSDIFLPPFTDDFGQIFSISANHKETAFKGAGWIQFARDVSRFKLIGGVRFNYFNLIKNPVSISPRLTVQYYMSKLTSINMSVGRYQQAPSFIWIVSNEMNKNLKYVSVNQYILGIEYLIRDDTKISVEGYVKEYQNYPASQTRTYLVMANTGAGFGGSGEGFASFGIDPLVSKGTGRAAGLELLIQKKLSVLPLYGTVSLSYNKAEFKALDGIKRPGSFDQRWIMNIGGGYVFNNEWEFSMRYRYVTGRPYTPYNEDLSKSFTLYNSKRVSTNFYLDLRLDKRWFCKNLTFITYFDIQNIFNRKIYTVPRYNDFDGKFEDVNGIGILPSIGFSVEF